MRAVRIAVTIAPTVASSLRAGMMTLTVSWPFASISRSGGQSCALLVRLVAHASTTGDMSVWCILIPQYTRCASADPGRTVVPAQIRA